MATRGSKGLLQAAIGLQGKGVDGIVTQASKVAARNVVNPYSIVVSSKIHCTADSETDKSNTTAFVLIPRELTNKKCNMTVVQSPSAGALFYYIAIIGGEVENKCFPASRNTDTALSFVGGIGSQQPALKITFGQQMIVKLICLEQPDFIMPHWHIVFSVAPLGGE
jgi:hypothetical protein